MPSRFLVHLALVTLGLCPVPHIRAEDPQLTKQPVGVGLMLEQLNADDWILRAEALRYLSDHKVARSEKPIRSILDDDTEIPWIRGIALESLAGLGVPSASELAIRFSESDIPAMRAAAAGTFEILGGDDAVQHLENLISDGDPKVRYRALAATARHRGNEIWPAVDTMTKEIDPSVLLWGVRALAWIDNNEARVRLATLSKNGDGLEILVRGMDGIPCPELIPILIQILSREDIEDRLESSILTALQHYDREALLSALGTQLKGAPPEIVRAVASVATVLVPSPELGDSLSAAMNNAGDTDTIKAGLIALGSTPMQPDRHLNLFTDHLNHEDPEVRALAIRCLAHCKEVNLFDILRKSIADQEPAVAQAALSALLRSPVESAPRGLLVDYLQEPLSGENEISRAMAFKLLGHAGGEGDFRPAMAMLGPLLRGSDDEKRAIAAAALGELAPVGGIREVVRSQGFIAEWKVLGTFLNDKDNKAFDHAFPPEEKIDFKAKYQSKYIWAVDGRDPKENEEEIEREIAWAEVSVDRTEGKLAMSSFLPPPGSYSIGYAVADFKSEAGKFLLSIDGDDAFRLWLNGEKIAEAVAPYTHRSPCVAERKGIEVTLLGGSNRFVVKSANLDHEWWVRIRLTDSKGTPVEVSAP